MAEHFIALDVHCAFSEMAAMTRTGKVVEQDRCDTTIPDLVRMLSTIGHLTGPAQARVPDRCLGGMTAPVMTAELT